MKKISRLQYISQGKTALEQEYNINKALDNGADWIQIRFKNAAEREVLKLSERTLKSCQSYKAICIINDSVAIAKQTGANGVHLGLTDTKITEARALLGLDKIIGGTANTLDHVNQRIQEGCDYIGLGPYRFTSTKEKLSPILGLEGYTQIIEALPVNTPPIFAIGGITLDDIELIRETGIYGVAISGLITTQPHLISTLKEKLQ